MTISKAIQEADENRPNAFSNEKKVRWLSELDGTIAAELMRMSDEDLVQFEYDPVDDLNTELLVSFPHDKIYLLYLIAKIDELNGEYGRYANSSALYNMAYNDFAVWFLSIWDPVQGYSPEEEV
ncbi:MAG: hypothetical protein IKG87_02670 [Clostridia bacterium]|nr:hypothetical protein [Clostridia bacterium]